MTNTGGDLSLSRLELVVLARLSSTKPPGGQDLGKAVRELALPTESLAHAKDIALATFSTLRGRGLASDQNRRRKLTEDGYRALRTGLELGHTPTWTEVRTAHLPALALGLRPGSERATKVLKDKDTMAAAVLGREYGVPDALTPGGLCDALIAEALGLTPGPVTLGRLRAHILARRAGVEPKGTADELAVRVAAKIVSARPANKKGMGPALARRWASQAVDSQGSLPVQVESPTVPTLSAQSPSSTPSVSTVQPVSPEQSGSLTSSPAQPVTAETLLTVVRETISRVGADGRFGPEKVFISAIWHSLERDDRVADLSLDRFKRWLVTANRDGWLVLARADLVGAMDARLVAESEIEDQGATFHFVLDRRAATPGAEQGIHAR